MTDGALTAEEILVAAEDALRRFGPEKANVVDVARALGVSHGTVYRHFASKAALRDAVMHRWLARISDPLAAIAASDVAPPLRLREWFTTLRRLKRAKAGDEPELFATYNALASDARDVVGAHVAEADGAGRPHPARRRERGRLRGCGPRAHGDRARHGDPALPSPRACRRLGHARERRRVRGRVVAPRTRAAPLAWSNARAGQGNAVRVLRVGSRRPVLLSVDERIQRAQ